MEEDILRTRVNDDDEDGDSQLPRLIIPVSRNARGHAGCRLDALGRLSERD